MVEEWTSDRPGCSRQKKSTCDQIIIFFKCQTGFSGYCLKLSWIVLDSSLLICLIFCFLFKMQTFFEKHFKSLDKLELSIESGCHYSVTSLVLLILQRGGSNSGDESSKVVPVFWLEVTVRSSLNCCPVIAQQTRITCCPNTPTHTRIHTHIENTWLTSWITAIYFHARTNAAFLLSHFGERQLCRGHLHHRAVVCRDQFRPVCLPVIPLGPRVE